MGKNVEKKKLFGFEGGFYTYTEKIFDNIALSFLWLLCCLPIITIGASTTALYYTVVKNVKGGRGYLTEEFVKSLRTNFKNGTILWLVIAVLGFVFQLNIGILFKLADNRMGNVMIAVYLVLLLFVTGIFLYGFPALARLEMSAGWIIKLSLYMTVRYFFTTILLLGLFAGTVVLVYYFSFLIFLLPALSCTLSAGLIEKVLRNHMPQLTE